MNPLTRRLATAAGLVTVILTAAAFALSYHHLARVAEHNGVTSPIAYWAWPACIDLFIVAGELLILRAVLRAAKDGFAVLLTIVGSVGSIVLNVFGVGMHEPAMSYVVAGVPPFAALLAFGAVMRQIHEVVKATEPVDTPVEPVDVPLPPVETPLYPPASWVDADALESLREPEPVQQTEEPAPVPATTMSDDEIIENGWRYGINYKDVAAQVCRHPSTIYRRYKKLDETHGKPAELAKA